MDKWLQLSQDQIRQLEANSNRAQDWGSVLVKADFDPSLVRNTYFLGTVRIGRLTAGSRQVNGIDLPRGITDSTICQCDIGDDVAIHHCHYICRYHVSDRSVILSCNQIYTTNNPTFGNGICKQTSQANQLPWLAIINEMGGRSILAFDQMIPADAFLWASYRQDRAFHERLMEITRQQYDIPTGTYGSIGDGCLIKNCRVIKDMRVGPAAVIDGADRLDNLTIHSSTKEQTIIGPSTVMVDGIVGLGSRIGHCCHAERFVIGSNCVLDDGAILTHTVLGDNSAVHGCEIRNCLLFPNHHQHHKNSFLIAACIGGQSNIAAGSTIGSNHNSRLNDNELMAGRGFWPGLCTSVKFPSRFASFVLLATGQYAHQLDISLPFALVWRDTANDILQVMPAYWWLYNMYGLLRNAIKPQERDKRLIKVQNIEPDPLAPDTIEQIVSGRKALELWVAGASGHQFSNQQTLQKIGRQILNGQVRTPSGFELLVDGIEAHHKARILKPFEAYHAYGQMLLYYAVKNIMDAWQADPNIPMTTLAKVLSGNKPSNWVNLGGQPVSKDQLEQLRHDIISGELEDWQQIHQRYQQLWQDYPLLKQMHAWSVLCQILDTDQPSARQLADATDQAMTTQQYIRQQARQTRLKDLGDPFRLLLYQDRQHMEAVVGRLDDDPIVQKVELHSEQFLACGARFKSYLLGQ